LWDHRPALDRAAVDPLGRRVDRCDAAAWSHAETAGFAIDAAGHDRRHGAAYLPGWPGLAGSTGEQARDRDETPVGAYASDHGAAFVQMYAIRVDGIDIARLLAGLAEVA
jgi:hypothetical protein